MDSAQRGGWKALGIVPIEHAPALHARPCWIIPVSSKQIVDVVPDLCRRPQLLERLIIDDKVEILGSRSIVGSDGLDQSIQPLVISTALNLLTGCACALPSG